MNRNIGKNTMMPSNEDRQFIFGLLIQPSNNSLINYIASKFNSIPDHNSRKFEVFDWIHSIRWVLERYNHYDQQELVNDFSMRCFNREIDDTRYEKLNKAIYLFENLKDYDDIQMVGTKSFNSEEMPELPESIYKSLYKEEILEENKTDFFSYNMDEQKHILMVYKSYLYSMNFLEGAMDESELYDYVIENIAKEKLSEPLKTNENIAIIESTCQNFIKLKSTKPERSISDDEITEFFGKELYIDKNLILTAYFLQYILMSLGAIIPKNNTPFGVCKVTGQQSKTLQRLLCASTTKYWNKLEDKSNTYYQTVNNMFKFDRNIIEEKNGILNHLSKVRTKLVSGGFSVAIGLLDEDVEKIKAYK